MDLLNQIAPNNQRNQNNSSNKQPAEGNSNSLGYSVLQSLISMKKNDSIVSKHIIKSSNDPTQVLGQIGQKHRLRKATIMIDNIMDKDEEYISNIELVQKFKEDLEFEWNNNEYDDFDHPPCLKYCKLHSVNNLILLLSGM